MKSSPCPSLLVSILFCYDFPGILFTFNHSSVFFSSILSVFFCGPIRNVGNVSKTALLLFFFFWLWEYSIRLLKCSFYSRSSWTFFRDYCIEFWIWGLVVGSIKILPSCLYALWKAFFVPRLMCHQYLFLVDPVFYLSVDVFFFSLLSSSASGRWNGRRNVFLISAAIMIHVYKCKNVDISNGRDVTNSWRTRKMIDCLLLLLVL